MKNGDAREQTLMQEFFVKVLLSPHIDTSALWTVALLSPWQP